MGATFQSDVLKRLRESGSDLARLHEFEFYIYVPTKSHANKAAQKIRSSGFSAAEVRRAESGSGWLCLARKMVVPAQADLSDHARFLKQVAAAVGGEWDGWEAMIVDA